MKILRVKMERRTVETFEVLVRVDGVDGVDPHTHAMRQELEKQLPQILEGGPNKFFTGLEDEWEIPPFGVRECEDRESDPALEVRKEPDGRLSIVFTDTA